MALHTRKRKKLGINKGKYRSIFESDIAKDLKKHKVDFKYETLKIEYTQPAVDRTYTPDFILPNGIIVEAKGRFDLDDRKKHLWIKDQHPKYDIRFVFQNSNSRLSKTSTTTYAMWCDKYGFKWAHKHIPKEWIDE